MNYALMLRRLALILVSHSCLALDPALSHLPDEIVADLPLIMVDRTGSSTDSHMRTLSVIQSVNPSEPYMITKDGFIKSRDYKSTSSIAEAITPNHVQVSGDWTGNASPHSLNANILGRIDTIYVDTDELTIPGCLATRERLAYYGAQLVKLGETVIFEANGPLPVTTMSIGANYADDYLMSQAFGGGFYLEYHDRPHFHMPLNDDAKGYLVLGKLVGEKVYHLTAFAIPFGYAVHTPGGIIHDDGLLVGDYLVIYSVTNDFKTAVVKDIEDAIVHVGVKIQPE